MIHHGFIHKYYKWYYVSEFDNESRELRIRNATICEYVSDGDDNTSQSDIEMETAKKKEKTKTKKKKNKRKLKPTQNPN